MSDLSQAENAGWRAKRTLSHLRSAVSFIGNSCPFGATAGAPSRSGRRRARAAIAAFLSAILALNAGIAILLDDTRSGLRDPEFSRRLSSLQRRVSQNPNRPLVIIVGSSRTAMGIRPDTWEQSLLSTSGASDPLLFNLSLIGGGPVLELITLQRAFAAGLSPSAILLEYWPPLFDEERDDPTDRMLAERLGRQDREVAHEFIADADAMGGILQRGSLGPVYSARHRLMSQWLPRWLPRQDRIYWTWQDVDGWGWKPGCDFEPGPSRSREILVEQARNVFAKRFADYRIDSRRDRAFRQTVVLARRHHVEVKLIYMPESTEFRGWYPLAVEESARVHLGRMRQELDVDVIDARTWMNDEFFSDGFHLTRIGAAQFTRKLGLVIAASMPSEKTQP